jgi:hypothetical protein
MLTAAAILLILDSAIDYLITTPMEHDTLPAFPASALLSLNLFFMAYGNFHRIAIVV